MLKWAIAFTLLQATDAAATLFLVQVHGFVEVNPVMRAAINIHPYVFLLAKGFGTFVILAALLPLEDEGSLWLMRANVAFMTLVVCFNLTGALIAIQTV